MLSLWKKVLVGLGASGMLAGGAITFAASAPGAGATPQGFWAQLAGKLNVSSTTLMQDVRAVKTNQLLQYANAHHWSPAKIKAAEARIAKAQFKVTMVRPHHMWRSLLPLVVKTTAATTHMKPGQVVLALRKGQTLTEIANAQHVAPSALQAAITNAMNARIQAALKAGKISGNRAKALEAQVAKMAPKIMTRKFHPKRPPRLAWMKPTAQYLGLSPKTIRQDLKRGETLGAVATSVSGKSVAGLESAITSALQTHLNTMVAHHHLSAAKEQALMKHWNASLPGLMNRHFTSHPHHGG